ncbi:hypothetical protein MBLNU459_g8348t1 [Dothideomycetes sp. NU459]
MERIIAVPNETNASYSRTARDGRKITYKLKVLQQPERARACGSGAKSSADRRPVDPPPIVELRIYEGDATSEKDITFQLNANYFLFATLEQARPIAQGRVPQDPNRLTVLTGTPVAGMVYLDRPEPAGYFIFPDLSVRHEGKYRLGFSLYEELKETKDEDQSEEPSANAATGVAEAHVTHRLEVKSQPFTVYSAKKFPGLASSTSLSRTVAEQGCRVRIRRDVRMRRREKTGKDYDGYSDAGYDRSRHSATPDMYQPHMAGAHGMVDTANRERSSSIASHVSLAAAPLSRRTSVQDMAQGYRQPGYPTQAPGPQAPPALPTASFAPPPQHYASQYNQQQPAMQPPHAAYQPYQYAQAPAQAPQQSYYSYGQAPPAHQYEPSHARNASLDYSIPPPQEIRRATVAHAPMYSYSTQGQSGAQQFAPGNGYNGSQPTSQSRQLSMSLPSASHQIMTPQTLPPINTSVQTKEKLEPSPLYSAVSSHYYDAPKMSSSTELNRKMSEVPALSGKRAFDRVFDSRHMEGPLRQGARPSTPNGRFNGNGLMADDNESELSEFMKMNYRRADGREIARPLPPSA